MTRHLLLACAALGLVAAPALAQQDDDQIEATRVKIERLEMEAKAEKGQLEAAITFWKALEYQPVVGRDGAEPTDKDREDHAKQVEKRRRRVDEIEAAYRDTRQRLSRERRRLEERGERLRAARKDERPEAAEGRSKHDRIARLVEELIERVFKEIENEDR